MVVIWMSGCSLLQAQVMQDSIYDANIKTVTLYKNNIALEAPILTLGSNDNLMLRFDELQSQVESYRYRIQHCDADWHIDDMQPYEYINGFEEGAIDDYRSSFTTLQLYTHYQQSIPATYSQLTISGNYIISVYRNDDPDQIVLTKRFMVSEQSLDIDAQIKNSSEGGGFMQNQEVNVALSSRPRSFIPTPQYVRVVVQQNGRLDNRSTLAFSGYDRDRLCYRYRPENVFAGGNSFRYFDISNMHTPMYNVQHIERYGGEIFALLRPEEDRSTKPFSTNASLNGGMKVNVWDRSDVDVEADYVWVNFSLPMSRPYLNGNIYIVGDLTQWLLNEDSRMEWNPQFNAYTKRLLLKQGYYAYQLLFLPIGSTQALTSTLEGDHSTTPNNYTVMVYYRTPADRYDRLVAVGRL